MLAMLCSIALADVARETTWLLLLTTFALVGATALLRAGGRGGMLAGFVTAAVFVVVAGLPADATSLATRILWFAGGALGALLPLVAARGGSAAGAGDDGAAARGAGRASLRDRRLRAHCLRLAGATTIGTALYLALGLQHRYWVPLTVLMILQPDERATDVRAIQRAAGTLVGVGLSTAATSGASWS